MRLPDGSYRRLTIKSPAGNDLPLFISADEAPATIARKKTTKQVARALAQAGAPDSITTLPRDGLVAHEWTALAEVRYIAATRSAIPRWHDDALRSLNVDPDAARRAFVALASPPPAPAASSG